jgi:hypothetical protein
MYRTCVRACVCVCVCENKKDIMRVVDGHSSSVTVQGGFHLPIRELLLSSCVGLATYSERSSACHSETRHVEAKLYRRNAEGLPRM